DVLIAMFDRAFAAARALEDEVAVAVLHNYVAAGYLQLGRLGESLTHLHDALVLRRKLGDETGETAVRINMATVHLQLGNNVQAANEARECIDRLQHDEVDMGRSRPLGVLGCAFMRLGELDTALRYQRLALASEPHTSSPLRSISLGEIAAIHRRMDHPRLAVLL